MHFFSLAVQTPSIPFWLSVSKGPDAGLGDLLSAHVVKQWAPVLFFFLETTVFSKRRSSITTYYSYSYDAHGEFNIHEAYYSLRIAPHSQRSVLEIP